MSGSPARRPGVEDLVGAYRADLVAAGMFAAIRLVLAQKLQGVVRIIPSSFVVCRMDAD